MQTKLGFRLQPPTDRLVFLKFEPCHPMASHHINSYLTQEGYKRTFTDVPRIDHFTTLQILQNDYKMIIYIVTCLTFLAPKESDRIQLPAMLWGSCPTIASI